jgi:DNA-binding LacI/PurR family transcriptional regulator
VQYLTALLENNLLIDARLIISTGYESDQFDEQVIEKFLMLLKKVDGIFALSNPIAAVALVKLKKTWSKNIRRN